MLLHWHIRNFDFQTKKLKDREFMLHTNTLDAATKAAVEATYQLGNSISRHDGMLKYRQLFFEQQLSLAEMEHAAVDGYGGICLHEYIEDENGNPTTLTLVARAATGDPKIIVVPAGYTPGDIEYVQSESKPIPIETIKLSDHDLEALAYFVRDLRAMEATAFIKEGPGRLIGVNGESPAIESSVTEDEIFIFAMIFRRLYMKSEPHKFEKIVELFADRVGDYPIVRWVQSILTEYVEQLKEKPSYVPYTGADKWTFKREGLLKVFIGSRYAHQPDDWTKKQYKQYLQEFGGHETSFTYLFLTELRQLAAHILNAGRVIARFYDQYCQLHGKKPKILNPLSQDNPGIGTAKTQAEKRQEIIDVKVQELAKAIWEQRGRPAGGPEQFISEAREALKDL